MCFAENGEFSNLIAQKTAPLHVARYFNFLATQPNFVTIASKLPKLETLTSSASLTSLASQVVMLVQWLFLNFVHAVRLCWMKRIISTSKEVVECMYGDFQVVVAVIVMVEM